MFAFRSFFRAGRALAPFAHFRHLHSCTIQVLRAPNVQNSANLVFRLCSTQPLEVDASTFEKACDETLESLTEYFEQIVEEADNLKTADVAYTSGVLTVNLGPEYGTYVINRQSPNRQIWLSSPVSGPKRYDFVVRDQSWVYKHDGRTLHRLLQDEISRIVKIDVNFADCSYGKL
ncbi:frataxin homolog, mitochondrial [Tribolium castaneum]|uniref:ferroxidase n=1 Tax=Tribolium castaneum TaxID=7070 RepID=D6X3T3_TRICA|nr:PREDICTED: frataxin homolog, mitochondrial [Tribolium castaneum]EEZ97465.1 Frataxin homolog, mitochondrial-like Protein [Tribolium castaneum]|eukprot:XP_969887.1 PREDICTED: frataxin homolog, mitochondrial [Tribolium castaneum]